LVHDSKIKMPEMPMSGNQSTGGRSDRRKDLGGSQVGCDLEYVEVVGSAEGHPQSMNGLCQVPSSSEIAAPDQVANRVAGPLPQHRILRALQSEEMRQQHAPTRPVSRIRRIRRGGRDEERFGHATIGVSGGPVSQDRLGQAVHLQTLLAGLDQSIPA
jgi:hypothetical protein